MLPDADEDTGSRGIGGSWENRTVKSNIRLAAAGILALGGLAMPSAAHAATTTTPLAPLIYADSPFVVPDQV